MSAWSANAWFSTAWYSEAWSSDVIDTHDGADTSLEEQRKRYKEAQARRREQIEAAFEIAFADPNTKERAKEIASVYLSIQKEPTIESVKELDFSQFNINPSHLDWLQTILRKKQERDEEDLIIAYLATRH